MVRVRIQKSKSPKKDWLVQFKNPKTGRINTIQGGDGKKNERSKSKRGQKAFNSRHVGNSPKQQINRKIWKGLAKVGSIVNIKL